MPNRAIDKPVLVLVEGLDYLHLIRHQIAKDVLLDRDVLLWDFKEGGLTFGEFLKLLRRQPKMDSVRAFGVICDAEFNRTATIESIRGHLRANGFVVPDRERRGLHWEPGDCNAHYSA